MSLREQRANIDPNQKRDEIHNKIKTDYLVDGQYHITRAEQRNIMLIGRTRTGKSTIKMLLVDPTTVPSDLTLKSDTRDPVFESFHINENGMILNVIDTPGLFEHSNSEVDMRDNQMIMRTIEICANRELTKFHVICFCVAITTGINKEDIESLRSLADFLGEEVSRNSCLIVTRCESKNEFQRQKMRTELMEDIYFKEIAHFFQLGIFFSGSLNPDDYEQGSESLYEQYFTICDYRADLIRLFTGNTIEPFLVKDTLISDVRQVLKDLLVKEEQLQETQVKNQELEEIIEQMRAAQINNNEQRIPELIDQLEALGTSAQNRESRHLPHCVIS